MGLWGGGWPGSWSDVVTDIRNAELWTSASYPELQECQETRNNCLNKKIFVWNTSDTLQRQDHVETSSSQMLFIFYILKSEMNFSFCLARHAAATVCCFLDFNSSLSTDSWCLSILTNAVMISGIVINTVNQIPPLRVALQQITRSHEVSSFFKLPPLTDWWPWILFDNKMIHEIKYNGGKNLDNYWPCCLHTITLDILLSFLLATFMIHENTWCWTTRSGDSRSLTSGINPIHERIENDTFRERRGLWNFGCN